MILELVTFNSPEGWDRARTLEDAKHVIGKWAANKELVRKHFLLGLGEMEGTGAGVYIWPSIEAAQHMNGTRRSSMSVTVRCRSTSACRASGP